MRLIYQFSLCILLMIFCQPLVSAQTLDNAGLASTSTVGGFSLRLLSSTYTGPLVRITVSSNYYDVYPDATTRNFSMTSKISAALSTYNAAVSPATTSALSTVISGSSATVAIWYNQSGGSHALQATTGSQPRIVDAGIIETTNSLPTIRFLGNPTFLIVTSTVFNNDLSGTVVFNATSANTSSGGANTWYNMNGLFGSEQSGGTTDFAYGVYNGKFTAGFGPSDNSVASTVIVNNATTRIHSWTRNSTSGAINIYSNGNSDGSSTLNAGSRNSVPSVAIGANQTFSSGQVFYNGTISEMILLASIYSSNDRISIEGNQGNYYTVAVTHNANLSALTISDGTLSPTFASDSTNYSASVPNSTANITVTPTKSDVNATIQVQVNGEGYAIVNSGSPSSTLSLNEGSNTIDVKVTASDATTIKIYTITVARAFSLTNANLFSLRTNAGSLMPVFSADTLSYTVPTVPNSTNSVTITPVQLNPSGTMQVQINDSTYANITSGNTSATLALNEGSNTIDVKVTAQDGFTVKIYTITLIRTASSLVNAKLVGLAISSGTLSPAFSADSLSYSISVPNATTNMTVTPTQSEFNAMMQVRLNGDSYVGLTSGSASSALSLNEGRNTIDVKVTAPDGTTTNVYTITVCRLPTATISGTSGPICYGANATFTLSGTSGAIVTYNINNGSNAQVTLTGGTTMITITTPTSNQTLNLVSVTYGTCTQNLNNSVIVIVSSLPTPSVSGTTTGCSIVNLTASGGTTYAWSGEILL